MVGVGVAGQRPVGGAAGLEAAGSPGGAGASVSSHLGGGAATAAGTAHSAGARGWAHPAITVPEVTRSVRGQETENSYLELTLDWRQLQQSRMLSSIPESRDLGIKITFENNEQFAIIYKPG